MSVTAICERLVAAGSRVFEALPTFAEFTGDRKSDELLNDLKCHPHAFVLACIMDRKMPAERAWLIPYHLMVKLGDFGFDRLRALSEQDLLDLMTKPEPLHRFPAVMSKNVHSAVNLIATKYGGNAAAIWANNLPSAEVVYRFLEFEGVGPKIATMAVNLLARYFKITFSDYYSIDVSADVHIRRVFGRLGLVPEEATTEQLIYRARALHPKFPGLLDLLTCRGFCRQLNCLGLT